MRELLEMLSQLEILRDIIEGKLFADISKENIK